MRAQLCSAYISESPKTEEEGCCCHLSHPPASRHPKVGQGLTGEDTGLASPWWAPSTGQGPRFWKQKLPVSASQVLLETLCREQLGGYKQGAGT